MFLLSNIEQIEKRRAEVNEEMAEIVNRFETATEALQPSDSFNSSAQNISLLDQSAVDNQMDQSDDESHYQNSSFKSAVNKLSEKSSKNNNSDASNQENHQRDALKNTPPKSHSSQEGEDDDDDDMERINIKKGKINCFFFLFHKIDGIISFRRISFHLSGCK